MIFIKKKATDKGKIGLSFLLFDELISNGI